MAGEAEQVPSVVHPLVEHVAADERRGALLAADHVEEEEQKATAPKIAHGVHSRIGIAIGSGVDRGMTAMSLIRCISFGISRPL